MLKKIPGFLAYMKAPRATYLLKHPIKGPKNLLALKGARSLLKTKGAAVTASVVAGAAAIPLALLARKKKKNNTE